MQEEELNNRGGDHQIESIGWIAIDSGTGYTDLEATYVAATTGNLNDHRVSTTIFDSSFTDIPALIAKLVPIGELIQPISEFQM